MTKGEKELLLRNYVGFSQILRTWLSTYGIGFFAFIAAQNNVVESLETDIVAAKKILSVILIGLIAQVIAALTYKYSTAYLYDSYGKRQSELSWYHNFSKCVDRSYILELVFDLSSVVAYGYGTYLLIAIVAGIA